MTREYSLIPARVRRSIDQRIGVTTDYQISEEAVDRLMYLSDNIVQQVLKEAKIIAAADRRTIVKKQDLQQAIRNIRSGDLLTRNYPASPNICLPNASNISERFNSKKSATSIAHLRSSIQNPNKSVIGDINVRVSPAAMGYLANFETEYLQILAKRAHDHTKQMRRKRITWDDVDIASSNCY